MARVKRSITATKRKAGGGLEHCMNVDASAGGRVTRWEVCAIGGAGEPGSLSIHRRGRRGGVRSADKSPGGMVLCSARGPNSKCVRAPYGAVVYPGGGTKLKRMNFTVLDGMPAKRRRKRRK